MGKIRLLHLADIHLGIETYGRLDTTTGLSSRLHDFTAVFDEAIEYALHNDVDFVLFAGDAYRTRDPNPTYQREFARRIRRLTAAGIPTFLLIGNHDVPLSAGRANTVDIFKTLDVENVYVGSKPDTHIIQTRRGPLQLVALPWVTRSLILSKEEYKNKTLDEINSLIAEKIQTIIRTAVSQLNPALPTILAAHLSVMGATWSSEKSVMLGQDVVLPRSELASPAFDYVALGHVHKHQVLSNHPLMVYAGSLERIDFGEAKEEKGFVIVDLERGSADFQFIPVSARRFVTIEVSAYGDNPLQQVLQAIEGEDVRGAIVRVWIHTSAEKEALIPYKEVRHALRDAYYVAAVRKIVQRERRTLFGGRLIEGMTPLEALECYLRSRSSPPSPERLKILLDYADKIIQEGMQ
ncbi:MAG: exonuclease SbcCD subunit D [Chloroflexi bacterium]|nr:exonuclease SbcCD subunit D [Chloroflexota bacterium]MCL5074935.1 exonuclease SbcCD subunit D [Chloroflexota bacterium]